MDSFIEDSESGHERKPIVTNDQVLEELKILWQRWIDDNVTYDHLQKEISLLQYTSSHVSILSMDALAPYEDRLDFSSKAGTFLTLLIKLGKEIEYTIYAVNFDTPLRIDTGLIPGYKLISIKDSDNVILIGGGIISIEKSL